MDYSSLDEIKNVFFLKSNNLADMRRELVQKSSLLHPDKNYGMFQDSNTEDQYIKMNGAIQYIDKILGNEMQLVPISAITEIIKVVKSTIPENSDTQLNKKIIVEQNFHTKLDTRKNDYLSNYNGPKIISTFIATIITIIWFFPNIINEHPILSHYIQIDNFYFFLLWIGSIATTSIIWILLKLKERRTEKILKYLKNEITQENMFWDFISWMGFNDGNTNNKIFTKSHFEHYILRYYSERHHSEDYQFYRKSLFTKDFIDIEVAHEIANILLLRAEEKKVIRKLDIASLLDEYELLVTMR